MVNLNMVAQLGWLTKQSDWLKDWRRRYFFLKGKYKLLCHQYLHCAKNHECMFAYLLLLS